MIKVYIRSSMIQYRSTSGAVRYNKGSHRKQYDTIKGYTGSSMIQ
jgi:hypothetical protein